MLEPKISSGFRTLNLPESLNLQLDRLNFHTPTPIQARAIPPALEGRDLIGIAQTGTGKTLAFGLPIAATLDPGKTALILAPTRELVLQIQETLRKLGMKTAAIIGGAPMNPQIRELKMNPQAIIATPGRLIDHLNQRTAHLGRVSVVVLDEADRMFDMGFAPAIRTIMERVPNERQTLMFSATMPDEIVELAHAHLTDPVRVEIERPGTAAALVSQEVWTVPHLEKPSTLEAILNSHTGTALVFARTRHGARKLAKAIRGMGHTADELHSDRTLAQRKFALHSFKTGQVRVLVATDIAARGIDVKEIGLVVNYDIPENPEDYVHRIGRTGRAGAEGRAITLATPQQHRDVKDIERLMKEPLARFNAAGGAERLAKHNAAANRTPKREASVQGAHLDAISAILDEALTPAEFAVEAGPAHDSKPGWVVNPKISGVSRPEGERSAPVKAGWKTNPKLGGTPSPAGDRPTKMGWKTNPKFAGGEGAAEQGSYEPRESARYEDRAPYARDSKPRFERGGNRDFGPRDRDSKPRFERGGNRDFGPRDRDSKPRFEREGGRDFGPRDRDSKPRFERDGGRDFKPRFERGGPSSGGPRRDGSDGRKPARPGGRIDAMKPRRDGRNDRPNSGWVQNPRLAGGESASSHSESAPRNDRPRTERPSAGGRPRSGRPAPAKAKGPNPWKPRHARPAADPSAAPKRKGPSGFERKLESAGKKKGKR